MLLHSALHLTFTAHDMAEDMLANGLASVTMIQRNATAVVPFEHYRVTHDCKSTVQSNRNPQN